MKPRVTLTTLAALVAICLESSANDGGVELQGKEALNKFLASFEPEIPWLIDHYIKNRRIRIIRTSRQSGRQNGWLEYRIISNESCIRGEVLTLRPKGSQSGASNPSRPFNDREHNSGNEIEATLRDCAILRPDAFFRINRDNTGKYSIASQGPGGSIASGMMFPGLAEAFVPLAVTRQKYSDLLKGPTLTVQSLSDFDLDGTPAIAIRCRASEGGGQITYYFDAKNHWVCRGWQSPDGGSRITYGPIQNGVAAPARIEVFRNEPHGNRIAEDVFEFDEFTVAHPDAGEFTLARFGLSEKPPAAEPVRGKDFGFHIILIGAGLLVAGVIIAAYAFARWKPAKTA